MTELLAVALGGLALTTYGLTLRVRLRTWRRTRTDVAWHQVVASSALLIVAIIGTALILVARLNFPPEVRGILGLIAWIAFGAAGIYCHDAAKAAARAQR